MVLKLHTHHSWCSTRPGIEILGASTSLEDEPAKANIIIKFLILVLSDKLINLSVNSSESSYHWWKEMRGIDSENCT